MNINENFTEYTISQHAAERYAERIMGREGNSDVKQFVITNKDKIKTDINKLILYGMNIYTGKQANKDGKNNIIDVFLKDTWVVLADNKTKNVITLYKIDLGLDDEFNKEYISKMMKKLNHHKEILETTQQSVQEESDNLRQMIAESETQIKEYKTMINHLEELCSGYKTIIEHNEVKLTQANKDVADIVNTLIGKREF